MNIDKELATVDKELVTIDKEFVTIDKELVTSIILSLATSIVYMSKM